MPRAEVVWNGEAKSYRVANEMFLKGRARVEDWPEELYNYLKATKGFTVVDKAPATAPKAAAPKAAPKVETTEPEPEPTVKLDGGDDEESPGATRGPRSRRR